MLSRDPLDIIILLGIFIISTGFHEAAHAYTAYYLGDSTPEAEGRLTINPIVHMDMMGSLMLVMVGFGWGKSVNVNPRNLSKPDQHMALIAAAGPAANLVLMLISTVLMVVVGQGSFLFQTLQLSALLNGLLMMLNLLPIQPLDGSKILRIFLPRDLQIKYDDFEPYGFIVLLALFFLPVFDSFMKYYLWVIPSQMIGAFYGLMA